MQLAVGTYPFDCGNAALVALHSQDKAGINGLAVHDHRAGATVSGLTPALGSHQSQAIPQQILKSLVRSNGDLASLTINNYTDVVGYIHRTASAFISRLNCSRARATRILTMARR